MSNRNGLITCPFNSNHKVLPIRLPMHLTRCPQKCKSSHYVRCPYNTTHVYTAEQISGHLLECPNRQVESEVSETKPTVKSTPGQHQEVEAGEDWNDDPPAETYNPIKKLKEKFIIVNPQGFTQTERRAFRQRENLRWNNSTKF